MFFDSTMGEDVAGITHCGIYVGNHKMLHCGSPIGYADLTDSYWQTHFPFVRAGSELTTNHRGLANRRAPFSCLSLKGVSP